MTSAPAPGGTPLRTVDRRLGGVVVLLLAASVAFVVRRAQVDLSFPVPWPDEGSFLWPALAFRDHFTLFARELNPTRHVLWMPPGFMVLMGTIFKIVPFSLSAARTVSALLVCGAVSATVLGFRRSRALVAIAVIAVAFLFSPILSLVGNVARMEALVMAITALGFFLVGERRAVGFAVLLLGPLVHPNGFFPCLAGACVFLTFRRSGFRASRVDRVAFAVVLLFWVLYAVYVFSHLPAFKEDMIAQLRFKQAISLERGGPMARLGSAFVLVPAAVLALSAFVSPRSMPSGGGEGLPRPWNHGFLAAALLVQCTVATGWLYEGYLAYLFLVTSAVALDVAAAELERRGVRGVVGHLTHAAFAALVLLVGMLAVRTGFVEHSLRRSTVPRAGTSPPYFTREDGRAVAAYLEEMADREGPIAVQFIPDGEALIFERLRGPRISFTQQTFYVGHFDVAVVHESVWFPALVHDLEVLNMFSTHHTPTETRVVRTRDGTEHFLALFWREP